jgi:hypothetical protein
MAGGDDAEMQIQVVNGVESHILPGTLCSFAADMKENPASETRMRLENEGLPIQDYRGAKSRPEPRSMSFTKQEFLFLNGKSCLY